MKGRMMGRLLVVPIVLSAVVGLASPASAGKPLVVERFRFEAGPFVDEFLLDICGFEVLTTVREKGTFILFDDGTLKEHLNRVITSTNPVNGITTTQRDARTFISEPVDEVVDEGAGTVTLVFEDTFVGLPFRQMLPGEGVLIRDAGKAVVRVTIVLDLESGEELSFDLEVIEVRGPHPGGELDVEERFQPLCRALAG